jgi:hypothetical protein
MEFGVDTFTGQDGNVQGIEFNVPRLMERLKTVFPDIIFEEEYYSRQLEQMRTTLSGHAGEKTAIGQAERDAEERGPRFGFSILSNGEFLLHGGVSRHCLSFRTSEATPMEVVSKAKAFLDTFAILRFGEPPTTPRG